MPTQSPTVFEWQETKYVGLYRLEISANGATIYAARVRPGAGGSTLKYSLPPFVTAQLKDKAARWRVVALASDGQFVGASGWREMVQN